MSEKKLAFALPSITHNGGIIPTASVNFRVTSGNMPSKAVTISIEDLLQKLGVYAI